MVDHEGKRQKDEDRDAEIYRMRTVNRWTLERIAEQFDLSHQRISQICAAERKKVPPVDLGAIRDEAVAMHLDVIRRAYEIADLNGAPVTAGKDGDIVRDPEDQSVVRDFTGRIISLRLANESMKELRKLLGIDAAEKLNSTSTVRYVVEGVDTEDLK